MPAYIHLLQNLLPGHACLHQPGNQNNEKKKLQNKAGRERKTARGETEEEGKSKGREEGEEVGDGGRRPRDLYTNGRNRQSQLHSV